MVALSAGPVEYTDCISAEGYNTKQSDGVIAHDRFISIGPIELNCNYAKLNCFKLIIFTFNCISTADLF